MERKTKKQKMNNAGFSLVELLIAMAILAIISVTIVTFMGQSSSTYTRTSSEATVQAEAQVVANAISDRIIDCTANVDYVKQGEANDLRGSIDNLSGTNLGSSTDGSILQICNELERCALVLDRDKKVIYYLEQTRANTTENFANYDYNKKQVLAENVKDFNVNTSRYASDHIIWFELTYEKYANENNDSGYKKEYKGTYQVNMRNHITINNGSTTTVNSPVSVQSITVSPAAYYVNIINGQPRLTIGADAVLPSVDFSATVKPAKAGNDNITWALKPVSADQDKKTGFTEKAKDASDTTPSSQVTFNVSPNEDDFEVKKFNVIAAKDGKQGAATVYVRKVTKVSLSPVSGLTPDKANNTNNMVAAMKSTVTFSSAVEGWNLDGGYSSVKWVLECKKIGGDYVQLEGSEEDNKYAKLINTGNGCSVVLGENAKVNCTFRITASSTFDNSKYASIEFGVKKNIEPDGNKTFARGVNIDMEAFFKAFGLESGFTLDELYSVYVSNIPGFIDVHEIIEKTFAVNDDNDMYIDYDPNILQYYDLNKLKQFYKELSLTITFSGSGWQSDGTYQDPMGNNVYHTVLPAVEVYRANADLVKKVHTYNDSNREEREALDYTDTDVKNEMKQITQDVVISKGNTKAVYVYTQAFNIVSDSLVGAYVDMTESNRGIDMISGSNRNSNQFLTASLTSSLGTPNKLQDYGVISFKAKDAKSSVAYPIDPMPVNVCVKNYYLLYTPKEIMNAMKSPNSSADNGQASFTTFNVYIANVEGSSIYVPGPLSTEWKNKGYNTSIGASEVTLTLGPAKTKVRIKKADNGSYRMSYNNKVYVYNTTLNYWQEYRG